MLLKNSLEITSLKYLGHNPPLSSLGHPTPDGLTLVIQPSNSRVLREPGPGLGEGRDYSGHLHWTSPLCYKTNSLVVLLWPQRSRGSNIHRSMCYEAARRSIIAPSWPQL